MLLLLFITVVLAITDWNKKYALQVVENHQRQKAKSSWTESANLLANGMDDRGKMNAGLAASSISQTLQKTVGRLNARPGKSTLIELGKSPPMPSKSPSIPSKSSPVPSNHPLMLFSPRPLPMKDPSMGTILREVDINHNRKLSWRRQSDFFVGRREHYKARYDTLHDDEKAAHHACFAADPKYRTCYPGFEDMRPPIGRAIKEHFAGRVSAVSNTGGQGWKAFV